MGFEIDRFVDKGKIVEEIVCSICTEVVKDPVQTPCEHLFCKECITKWLTENHGKNCPIDRKALSLNDLKPPGRMTRKLFDKLIIKCKNSSEGCKLMAKYEDMPHLIKHETEECHVVQNVRMAKIQEENDEQKKKVAIQDSKFSEFTKIIPEMERKILEQQTIIVQSREKNQKAWKMIEKQGKELIAVIHQQMANEDTFSLDIGTNQLFNLAIACEEVQSESGITDKVKIVYQWFFHGKKVFGDPTTNGIITKRDVKLWKDSDVTLKEFPEYLNGSLLYPSPLGIDALEITIEVAVECNVIMSFSSNEYSATQLQSMGFQRVEGSIQTSGFVSRLQNIYKKCVANMETIKLPRTATDYPRVAIFVK